MMMHGLTESRTIYCGDGSQKKQRKFYCHVHGWIDLFVFPDSEAKHAKCCNKDADAGAVVAPPKTIAKAD